MSQKQLFARKFINILQSVLIIAIMALIFAVIGLMIAGVQGLVLAIILGTVIFLLSPRLSPAMVLKMYNASRLSPETAPGINRIVRQLSDAAGLPAAPEVHYVPSRVMNAFSVGKKSSAAIVVTDGLLRAMNWSELAGILAHEVSHIEHNDLWIMGLADSISRFTNIFSIAGFFLLALYFPVIVLGGAHIPIWAVLIVFFAPYAMALLQLALSRTREFDADLNAVKLTGDPRGLASALSKLENYQIRLLDFFLPGRRVPGPSILRTHPHTKKRVEILMGLASTVPAVNCPGGEECMLGDNYPPVTRQPRWRVGGIWH